MRGLSGMREMFCNWFGVMLIGVCIIVRIHQTEHVKSMCFTVIWLCLSKCVWIENCKYLTKLLNPLNVTLSQTHLRRKNSSSSFKLMIFTPFCHHRFCVAIKKENYPDYMPSNIFSDSAKQIFRQPGHTIYLLPTVVICNLLPCELDFYVKGMPINGTLKPGKEVALHTADTSQNIELGKGLVK